MSVSICSHKVRLQTITSEMTDIKVVVLGKMFSGKTALIQRYATNDFSILHAPTIGKNMDILKSFYCSKQVE